MRNEFSRLGLRVSGLRPWSARLAASGALSLLLLEACAATPASGAVAPSVAAVPSPSAAAEPPGATAAEAVVVAGDRSAADRAIDSRRQPSKMLEFIGVGPGERVADLGAGAGYTTELLARAVGPSGVVYAQNDVSTLDAYVREAWQERLQQPVNKNVVPMDRPYEAPFAPEASALDCVTLLFSYHDVVARNGDRSKLNRAVFRALKPGGFYVIADHDASAGTGVEAARELHRIEEAIVRREVEAAGFVFVEGAEFLKDEDDDPTKPSPALDFRTSRFIHKYKKPG